MVVVKNSMNSAVVKKQNRNKTGTKHVGFREILLKFDLKVCG